MIYFLVFVGGLLLSSMQSLNGLLSGYLGLFGTSFAVHVIGGVLLAAFILLRLLVFRKKRRYRSGTGARSRSNYRGIRK